MNLLPLISICIPTYNQTIHLQKLIISILNQKEVNYEIIVTDDSSNNDVQLLIEKFNSNLEEKQILYFRNSPALGAPKNWNFGLSLAKGEYIKPMHHDQWFEDDFALKKLLSILLNNKNTFVFSAAINNFRGKVFEFRIKKNELNDIINEPEKLILANLIGGPTAILYPSNAKIIFDEKIIWLVDVEFYLQLFRKGYKVKYIDECLYTSMTDFDSLTNNNLIDTEKQLYEYSYLYNKYTKNLSRIKKLKYAYKIDKIIKLQIKKKQLIIQTIRFIKRILFN